MSSEADNTTPQDTDASSGGLQPNTVSGTLIVAAVLCLVCSMLVSGTAVALRSTIAANEKLDRQKNVLLAAGLFDSKTNTKDQIPELFKQVETVAVALPRGDSGAEAGEVVDLPSEVPTISIPPELDLGGIKSRETIASVFVIKGDDVAIKQFVLPVYGKGLWSTLYGYLALSADVDEGMPVGGITFYKHAETPGLGGEVDNPKWKALWPGKELFNDEWQPVLEVTKPDNAKGPTEVDGMSGATVTSNGVEGLVNYWLGDDGFGPFLERYRSGTLNLTAEATD